MSIVNPIGKSSSNVVDGSQDVCSTPTAFLLLRGLAAETDEKSLLDAFSAKIGAKVVRIWLVRDKQTRQSKGFAFAQFENAQVWQIDL